MIYSFPEKRDSVIYHMRDLILEKVKRDIDKLTTTATAGIPICSFVGNELGIGTTYVKKKAKPYGLEKKIEGQIEKGEYVISVDDLATTGSTAETCVKVVRSLGAEIDKYFVIFDRKQGASEKLADLNVELYSLAWMSREFIDMGLEKNKITRGEYQLFSEYSENPTEWSRNLVAENPEYLRKKLEGVVEEGKIKDTAPLEVLTKAHPELKDEFEPKVRKWLVELGVEHEVPEFDYEPTI